MTLTPLRGGAGLSGPAAADSSVRRYVDLGDLALESGRVLPDVRMAYQTWGTLNAAGDNAVLVLHALTGDSHVVGPPGPDQPTPGWWDGLIGPGAPLDDTRYFVVAANVLGGCRGTTGPATADPDGRPWGSRFPRLTVRDQVAAEAALADRLGITSFAAVLGGSMGGMRALEWAIMQPERVRRCIAIATTPTFSGDQIAWSAPQLAAIRSDPNFQGGDYYDAAPPLAGMAVARQIAHITYRSAEELNERFGRAPQTGEDPATGGRYAVQSYLEHHGDKLCRRFDPNSYLVLTESMNSHDIGRGRGGVAAALAMIRAELTVAVVDSDRLFLPGHGAVLATAPTARPLVTIRSDHGHDGFLIETEQVAALIRQALD
ncbi:MAG TPA: homoserine O-acetyltransferase [Micromonosporaceae bacterium]|nr:homoserine O-acetyltransferase [Micromonosporaceae bacterium]